MNIARYIAAYMLWLVNLLLGLWLVFISRNAWLSAFDKWYIQGSPTYAWRAALFDKILILILGFGWLILVVVCETNFRNGVKKQDLFRRFARATAPVVLLIFAVDVFLTFMQGIGIVGWARLFIMLVELVLGIWLILFGWRKRALLKPLTN